MQLIEHAAHRSPLESQKRRQFLIGEQSVCQQQAQGAPLTRGQAQPQQGDHLLFLQTVPCATYDAIGQVSYDETTEASGSPRRFRRRGSVRRSACLTLLVLTFFQA